MASPLDPNNAPALEPPQGITPNLVDPPTIAPSLVAGLAVMFGVATLGLVARMFTKIHVMKKVQSEDYSLVFGWAFAVAFYALIFAQVPFGIGRNQWNVSIAQMKQFLEYVNLTELMYIISMFFIKLAILIQLKSIFRSTTRDWIYWLIVLLMGLTLAFHLAIAVALIAQCVPREKIWSPGVSGICVDNSAATISSGAFNFAIDMLIFMVPICAIYKLKMAVRRKLGICAVFGVGLLACISSILRLYYSVQLLDAADLTFNMVSLCWASSLETVTAMLVACCPVMPRLYQYLRGERPSTTSSGARAVYRPSNGTPPYAGYGRSHGYGYGYGQGHWRSLETGVGKVNTVTMYGAADGIEPSSEREGAAFPYHGTEKLLTSVPPAVVGFARGNIQKTITIETRYQRNSEVQEDDER